MNQALVVVLVTKGFHLKSVKAVIAIIAIFLIVGVIGRLIEFHISEAQPPKLIACLYHVFASGKAIS